MIARLHGHLRGLATAIHEISGLKLILANLDVHLYLMKDSNNVFLEVRLGMLR